MRAAVAFTTLLAVASAVSFGDTPDANGITKRDDDIKDVFKDLKKEGKVDPKGTILLTTSGIISQGPGVETKEGTGSAKEDGGPKQLAQKKVENMDKIIKKFHKLREKKFDEPGKKNSKRAGDKGDVCKSNGDCDDDQPMCAIAEKVAGPNVCMKLAD